MPANAQIYDRPTIQDGRVYDIAEKFETWDGILGEQHKALGIFHISVSRNRISIHHCSITNDDEFDRFQRAMNKAYKIFSDPENFK